MEERNWLRHGKVLAVLIALGLGNGCHMAPQEPVWYTPADGAKMCRYGTYADPSIPNSPTVRCNHAPTKAQSWDQENLKMADVANCETANPVFVAPGGNLTQCP